MNALIGFLMGWRLAQKTQDDPRASWTVGVFLLILFLLLCLAEPKKMFGQPCTVSPTTFQQLPAGTGTTPASHEIVAPQGGNYVYVASQWGVLRAVVGGHPQQPGPFSLFGVGIVGGFPGGVIPIKCDCFAAWRAFDAAEAGGQARIIGGWQPYDQGGAPPPGPLFSGLAAQLAQGQLVTSFGQQINLPSSVPIGGRSAVLAVTGKFFAYFPVKQQGVYLANVSTPSGSAQWQDGITTSQVIGWNSSSTVGVRLAAAVAHGTSLLVGSTPDLRLHVATIDPNTGIPTEVASTAISENPVNLDIGVVNGRTFIFSAEDASGLRVYEYANGAVTFKGSISGRTKLVQVKGGTAYPYVFRHRLDQSGSSYIDVYDTHWLVSGGVPNLGASLPTLGDPGHFLAYGFDSYVDDSAPAAYVYREANPVPPQTEQNFGTTRVSLACLNGGSVTPTPPPGPTPTPGAGHIFQDWIYQVVAEKLMSACGPALFCPGDAAETTQKGIVSRGQMAVFLLKSEHGANYVPPPCVPPGTFSDVPCSH